RKIIFIENNTGFTLRVQAQSGSDFVVLQNSQIAPASTEQIYTAGSNTGSTRVSDSFSTFQVAIKVGIKDSVIYQAVRDSDWDERNTGEGFSELYLTISP
ncbi:MAG: hypothetical protein AAF570_08345, partial [Bacteroidota bacterium]